jgi:hypothetical protein
MTQALEKEPPLGVSSAQERILERGFFALPETPAVARVVAFSRPAPRLPAASTRRT